MRLFFLSMSRETFFFFLLFPSYFILLKRTTQHILPPSVCVTYSRLPSFIPEELIYIFLLFKPFRSWVRALKYEKASPKRIFRWFFSLFTLRINSSSIKQTRQTVKIFDNLLGSPRAQSPLFFTFHPLWKPFIENTCGLEFFFFYYSKSACVWEIENDVTYA